MNKDSKKEIPKRSLEGVKISFEILKLIPEESARHYQFIPIGITDRVLEVGIVDPDNIAARDALHFISSKINYPFKLFLISKSDFDNILQSYKNIKGEVGRALKEFEDSDDTKELEKELKFQADSKPSKDSEPKTENIIEEAPVTKIVAVILNHATEGNASDVHIEPMEKQVRVRFRVDGILYTSLLLPTSIHDAVVARIKILTNMKLDERRKPQDGRFSANIATRSLDFRVSSLPTSFGEKIVIRILDPQKGIKSFEGLGLSEENIKMLKEVIAEPYGLILITGPTGSGKTTTLNAILNILDREKSNVISLEDPIEYNVEGVSQSQVRPEIKYTFASGLRSILRQDPDIIMVGEIRDKETAELAIQASLTGHLVFSTLHTNNASGVVPRLVNMGVEPFLIAATLKLAIAQRLSRVLCKEKDAVPISAGTMAIIEKQLSDIPKSTRDEIKIPETIYHAKRSAECPSGTRGRIGVFEMYKVDNDMESQILNRPIESEIFKLARSKGMLTMKDDGLIKSFNGIIPFEEVNKL